MMKRILLFLALVILFGCNNDEDEIYSVLFGINDSNYPTRYRKLTPLERENKQKAFEQGQFTFAEIDSFGFVGWSYNSDYEVRKQLYSNQFTDVATLITEAKLYLVEKSEFTGIIDTAQLVPQKIDARFLDFGGAYSRTDSTVYNHLGISFGEQEINGLEVYNSLLNISANATGVHHIFGHWYPDVYIPPTDQVSVELARTVLTGRELTSYNGWHQKLTHTIAESDLQEYRKIIYPYITKNHLELRVCWEFKPSHWQIFMDTTTGEILLEQDTNSYLF
jgi:hypothetical protein